MPRLMRFVVSILLVAGVPSFGTTDVDKVKERENRLCLKNLAIEGTDDSANRQQIMERLNLLHGEIDLSPDGLNAELRQMVESGTFEGGGFRPQYGSQGGMRGHWYDTLRIVKMRIAKLADQFDAEPTSVKLAIAEGFPAIVKLTRRVGSRAWWEIEKERIGGVSWYNLVGWMKVWYAYRDNFPDPESVFTYGLTDLLRYSGRFERPDTRLLYYRRTISSNSAADIFVFSDGDRVYPRPILVAVSSPR